MASQTPPLQQRLQVFDLLTTPVWIFDIEQTRMWWANQAAVRLWDARDRDELLQRDMGTDMSSMVRLRLHNYLQAFQQGHAVQERWTFFPRSLPTTVHCRCSGITLDDERLAMLVEGSVDQQIDPETLRSVEALRHTSVMISLYDQEHRLLYRNPAARDRLPTDKETFSGHFLDPDDGQAVLTAFEAVDHCQLETQVHTRRGLHWHHLDIGRTFDPLTGQHMTVVSETDITDRRLAEEDLRAARDELEDRVRTRTRELTQLNHALVEEINERRRTERLLNDTLLEQRLILDNAVVGIAFVKERQIFKCNRRCEEIYGYPPGGLLNRPSIELYTSTDDYHALGEMSHPVLARGKTFRCDYPMRRQEGDVIWCSLTGKAMQPLNLDAGVIWIIEDITERKQAEQALYEAREKLEVRVAERTRELAQAINDLHQEVAERKQAEERIRHLAHHDPLTGLPNRSLLKDRVEQALAHCQRHPENRVAVLFIDLDRFKTINDCLGHYVGDRLLRSVARRLSDSLRDEDTVARLGGDEFVIVLPDLRDPQDADAVARKIVAALSRSFLVDGYELHITPSIGIALSPEDGRDGASLMKNADTAMYHAKDSGRNNHQFFRESMNRQAMERLTLENNLRGALERGEFLLHYQPQVAVTDGRLIGVEVLLRWQHPQRGLVPPDLFIPIAEETGMIIPLGDWVLREACRQTRLWQDQGLGRFTVAVNLSARQFHQRGLRDGVRRALADSGLEPDCLELELTESLLMNHAQDTINTLNDLHRLGVQLSIDDFGTGYSSLAYLKRFPIDNLKIDRSFVRDITTDNDDAVIAQTIIAMAHSLKLKVIAEGVETAEQLALLHGQGCDAYQGYYYSRPLPAPDLETLLRGQPASPPTLQAQSSR